MFVNRLLLIEENEAVMVIEGILVSKIDEKRGAASRLEYLSTLIDRELRETARPPEPPAGAVHDELRLLVPQIRELRQFLESATLHRTAPPPDAFPQEPVGAGREPVSRPS